MAGRYNKDPDLLQTWHCAFGQRIPLFNDNASPREGGAYQGDRREHPCEYPERR